MLENPVQYPKTSINISGTFELNWESQMSESVNCDTQMSQISENVNCNISDMLGIGSVSQISENNNCNSSGIFELSCISPSGEGVPLANAEQWDIEPLNGKSRNVVVSSASVPGFEQEDCSVKNNIPNDYHVLMLGQD